MSLPARVTITPAAVVAEAPSNVTDVEPRCWRCDRQIAFVVTRPWKLLCSRCRAVNASPPG